MKGRRLSQEERNQIVESREHGCTIAETARRYKCSSATVCNVLREYKKGEIMENYDGGEISRTISREELMRAVKKPLPVYMRGLIYLGTNNTEKDAGKPADDTVKPEDDTVRPEDDTEKQVTPDEFCVNGIKLQGKFGVYDYEDGLVDLLIQARIKMVERESAIDEITREVKRAIVEIDRRVDQWQVI